MKKLLLLLPLLLLFVAPACHTTRLEPGGAYAHTNTVPDIAFFQVESAYDLAYSSVDALFKFERENRLMLWNFSPQIKHTLDNIRPKAVAADQAYIKARATYMANPTPAGLSVLNEILQKMQQYLSVAQSVVPKPA